jgi:hypothetical protein
VVVAVCCCCTSSAESDSGETCGPSGDCKSALAVDAEVLSVAARQTHRRCTLLVVGGMSGESAGAAAQRPRCTRCWCSGVAVAAAVVPVMALRHRGCMFAVFLASTLCAQRDRDRGMGEGEGDPDLN